MKIINLIENTCHKKDLFCEHGLSFYVETSRHKILMDSGASNKFLHNAQRLGVDVSAVDTVVLSHGHYDHCGGVPTLAELNPQAVIYLRVGADGAFYHVGSDYTRYIGIEKRIMELPQLRVLTADLAVDDELFIFGNVRADEYQSLTNRCLQVRSGRGEFAADDFRHEQYLEVSSGGKRVLFSGCAHNGIVNIMRKYYRLRGCEPDVVISGFHTMNPGDSREEYTDADVEMMKQMAMELQKYNTVFYTCHCTGLKPFVIFHDIMGERIRYISTGDILEI